MLSSVKFAKSVLNSSIRSFSSFGTTPILESTAGTAQKVEPERLHAMHLPLQSGLDIKPREYKLFTKQQIGKVLQERGVNIDYRPWLAAASVLPMRTNNYVVEELIDWSNIPDDPIFQLVFPQPGMLSEDNLNHVMDLICREDMSRVQLRDEMENIRNTMNPHPAGQKALNVPKVNGEEIPGMQHKYRETALFFATEAQYCHSFCTYCFRWAQFTAVGSSQQFASKDAMQLRDYLKQNTSISDLLFTGGDPMVMKAQQFEKYINPILEDPDMDHISTIRIGTKSVAYWPHRFVTDSDSDDILRLFERIVASGRHISIMGHYSHHHELETPVAQEAIRRILNTGAQIRCQAPLIRHVNDDPSVWATMWRTQLRLGAIPYYMFVERDTGARHYFEVPLHRAVSIYNKAVSSVSGLGRTVRGPSMSAEPGKVHVLGVGDVGGQKAFVLRFLQARNPEWMDRVFFAKYDENAVWLHDLKPLEGDKFFYEEEFDSIKSQPVSSGVMFPFEGDFVYDNKIITEI
jgi:L-lysine 2,3-aminomutase